MSSSIETALNALWVGMLTVFVALALVVLAGQLLIRGVNALSGSMGPDEEDKGPGAPPPEHAAVLAAAIAAATGGEGRIAEVTSNQS
jgi:hypothetical protein